MSDKPERPSGGVDLSEFLHGFVVEADEHLGRASKNLLEVEADLKRDQPSPRAVRELYRSLHTIKGLSAMMGIEPVVQISHALESALRVADRAGGRLHPAAIDGLMRGLHGIERRVGALAAGKLVAPVPLDLLELLGNLPAAGGAQVAPGARSESGMPPEVASKLSDSEKGQLATAGGRAVRVDFVPAAERSAAGLDITRVRDRLGKLGELVKVVPLPRPRGAAAPGGLVFAILMVSAASDADLAEAAGVEPGEIVRLDGASASGGAPPDATAADGDDAPAETGEAGGEDPGDAGSARRGVVRVDVARLDDALEKLSDLVVTRSRLHRALEDLHGHGVDVRAVSQIAQEMSRQLRGLRRSIMQARLVSVAEMLERLPLLVRGLQRSTGKAVDLEVDTGRAELDKSVAERIFPAVIHLVRNAIDHALEPAEERQRLGKPPRGRLRVVCREQANNLLQLTISDDGRGIDAAALAARAGKEPPASEEALLALMALPGLSTRTEVSTTSGRGMGMNIVRKSVEELGGQLSVETTAGQGTSFTLAVPLTITIIDAFSFRCGEQPFVVPVSAVEEIVEIDPAQVTRAPSGKGRAPMRMLDRRGSAVPLVSLERVFHLEAVPGDLRKAIVVRRNGQPFGFEVDQMLGHQEVVVRPLEDALVKQPGIVGSTDLGDGRPTLVLDLVSLCGRLSRRRTDARA